MDYLVPKAPADEVAYFLDFTKQMGADDAIATFTLVVTSGTVTLKQPAENFGAFLRFIVEGGADGETALLTATVNTVLLQEFTREAQLYIASAATSVTPSTATKKTVLGFVFRAMGLADYEFNISPEEWAAALITMDAQMATWSTNGLQLNYNFPLTIGSSDLSDESGLPDDAILPVSGALAFAIAPAIGKSLSKEQTIVSTQGMNALRARYMPTPERPIPWGTPRGAGQKPWSVWWPYGFGGPSFPARRC